LPFVSKQTVIFAKCCQSDTGSHARRTGSPQGILAFALFGETSRKDEAILEVDSPRGFAAFVRHSLLFDLSRSRVDAPDLSILASEDDLGSIPIPASRIDLKTRKELQSYLDIITSGLTFNHNISYEQKIVQDW
jgi:hypothetical protein